MKVLDFPVGQGRGRTAALLAAAVAVSTPTLLAPSRAASEEVPIMDREKASGTWRGARGALEDRGTALNMDYVGETFSVLSGGLRRGTTYEGRLVLGVDLDLRKLVGWNGATVHATAFQIHNGGANVADYAGTLSDPSNIDALPATRLFTAWFQQEFGTLGSLRVGQLAADDEFLTSDTAGGLLNGTFGWANIMAANLPSGGAAYPLATPGARLQLALAENVTLLAGVFSGDPAGRHCYRDDPEADPQACNRDGTTFSLAGGAFWIGELQYEVNRGADATGLAASYKIGAWYHTGRFSNQRFGVDAAGNVVTLAHAPDDELLHRGNWGVYGVVDQMVWRDQQRHASVFVRGGLVPSDHNLVSWYVDAGIGFKGLIAGRPDDTLTLGVGHTNISRVARGLDHDTLALDGGHYPLRNAETVFEVSYAFQLAPWWTFQPDLQYIVRPEGGVVSPDDPNRRVGNVLLLGARSTMTF